MVLRRMVASMLVSLMMLSSVEVGLASDATTLDSNHINKNEAEVLSELTEEKEVDKLIISGVDDLDVQLDNLYKEVGRELNIDYVYVKIMHLIAGGKAVYADKRPNIYAELTVNSIDAPFDIDGANQTYSLQAPWVSMPDETVKRPSKYYLPDAAYSTAADVVKLMNKRYYADRGQMTPYFNALNNDVKTTVIFCEAMLEYTGASKEAVDSFYSTYEKIMYEKDKYENVVESNEDGTYTIKDEFKDILISNNISNESDLRVLSIILSFDSNLAASSDPNEVKEEYVMPYKLDYTSRENMMIAAMSVVGKVRYVWGGGHLGTGTIEGINPSWEAFSDSYETSLEGDSKALDSLEIASNIGAGMCIQPTASWCPIHGLVESENGCLMQSETVYSAEDYVDSRKEIIDTGTLSGDKYINLLECSIDFTHGVTAHRLDGLDCSGYASWLYNQISSDKTYDSGAMYFIQNGELKTIPYGDKLLPGDVFSWGEHIVINIGPSSSDSNAYVIIESSPNMVKFGVMYYGYKASKSDIDLAISIAKEANDLIGNLPLDERTNVYNMDNYSYAQIGRLSQSFLDEDIVIEAFDKKIKDMDAKEIIQYVIDRLPDEYISGISDYSGTIFDVNDTDSTEIAAMARSRVFDGFESLDGSNESGDQLIKLTSELTSSTNDTNDDIEKEQE